MLRSQTRAPNNVWERLCPFSLVFLRICWTLGLKAGARRSLCTFQTAPADTVMDREPRTPRSVMYITHVSIRINYTNREKTKQFGNGLCTGALPRLHACAFHLCACTITSAGPSPCTCCSMSVCATPSACVRHHSDLLYLSRPGPEWVWHICTWET